MIDFAVMEEKVIPHFKGGEGSICVRMFDDGNIKIFRGCLAPGSSIGVHCHETSSEVIYILSGVGTALLEGVEEILYPGQCHYCPKGGTHTLMNKGTEDLVFLAVVPEQ
ncbi:MAG: cupin domain-containing protein [Oscillospiraceae bacterium]|nr:cupin domain-containing protein [Oscillospiraceae bacterium]